MYILCLETSHLTHVHFTLDLIHIAIYVATCIIYQEPYKVTYMTTHVQIHFQVHYALKYITQNR